MRDNFGVASLVFLHTQYHKEGLLDYFDFSWRGCSPWSLAEQCGYHFEVLVSAWVAKVWRMARFRLGRNPWLVVN